MRFVSTEATIHNSKSVFCIPDGQPPAEFMAYTSMLLWFIATALTKPLFQCCFYRNQIVEAISLISSITGRIYWGYWPFPYQRYGAINLMGFYETLIIFVLIIFECHMQVEPERGCYVRGMRTLPPDPAHNFSSRPLCPTSLLLK